MTDTATLAPPVSRTRWLALEILVDAATGTVAELAGLAVTDPSPELLARLDFARSHLAALEAEDAALTAALGL